MAAIDISSAGGGGSVATGVLQLQNGVALDATLRFVTDQSNTLSPLKLSTTLVQTLSTLKITTADNPYIDAEDNSGNNRFTIGRDPSSQQVNLDFASNPTGSTTNVGAIRTYVDGVNLSEVLTFREDGRLQVGSTSASAMYWDNANNRLGIGTATPTNTFEIASTSASPFKVATTQSYFRATFQNSGGSGIIDFNSTSFQFPVNNVEFGTSTALLSRVGIKGSGSTSATTSLLVQNSAGTQLFKINDAGNMTVDGAIGVFNFSSYYYFSNGGNNSGSYLSGSSWATTGTLTAGVTTVNASAILQADSTTKGFLPPRMTTAEKNAIATPAAGLIVYDTTLNKLCVRTAAAWETITSI